MRCFRSLDGVGVAGRRLVNKLRKQYTTFIPELRALVKIEIAFSEGNWQSVHSMGSIPVWRLDAMDQVGCAAARGSETDAADPAGTGYVAACRPSAGMGQAHFQIRATGSSARIFATVCSTYIELLSTHSPIPDSSASDLVADVNPARPNRFFSTLLITLQRDINSWVKRDQMQSAAVQMAAILIETRPAGDDVVDDRRETGLKERRCQETLVSDIQVNLPVLFFARTAARRHRPGNGEFLKAVLLDVDGS